MATFGGMFKEPQKTKQLTAKRQWVAFALFFSFGRSTDAQNVVNGYIVKESQPNQNVCGNVTLSKLVIAVHLLRAVEDFCQLLLGQIPVFSQISDSSVHKYLLACHKDKFIIPNRKMRY